ncbi:cobalamin B12-binding domain-containing protein [Phytohabitans houttuyneae]|uniref:Cobalamin-binding protein n=1 Tax=Phytohabitans houttuyneae TaxID=1076126 RepID=A0A6V8KFY7_9ACTN|nr:cobalamin B12-binding domain-containing protein [Phytohabitans houttuyneae]GFJ82724.1 cobalamin-binding protein [Phytohabitans houttuyneae]
MLLGLVAPAQAQVGTWWQRNEWSVAQEHAATHVSERVVAAVSAAARVRPRHGRVVVACMDGEWHALPPRIVAEVLRLDGWEVTFLGASVPAAHLVSYLHRHDPRAVALACALPMRLPQAARMVDACRRTEVPIIVGGRGFGPDGRWAARLGVPWAADANAAAALLADDRALDRLLVADRPQAPVSGEYTALAADRADLVAHCFAQLEAAVPQMAGYTTAQRDATLTDLGHIVDTLAAAVFVDDAALFGDFHEWLGEVLTSRGVPLYTVDIAFRALAERLRDFPVAHRILRDREGK